MIYNVCQSKNQNYMISKINNLKKVDFKEQIKLYLIIKLKISNISNH